MSSIGIDPELSFRFPISEIKDHHTEANKAFENCDFMTSLQLCPRLGQLKACSFILCVLTHEGIEILKELKSLDIESVLCLGYGLWVEEKK